MIVDPHGRKRAWLTTNSLLPSPHEFFPGLTFVDAVGERTLLLAGGTVPQLHLDKGKGNVIWQTPKE